MSSAEASGCSDATVSIAARVSVPSPVSAVVRAPVAIALFSAA